MSASNQIFLVMGAGTPMATFTAQIPLYEPCRTRKDQRDI
jgi:hypothetical protein